MIERIREQSNRRGGIHKEAGLSSDSGDEKTTELRESQGCEEEKQD